MPPIRNAAATRERLLACAHRRFLNESYENVGLREIAADAGVDVALVGRYFGSKEQLFKQVLRKDGGNWQSLALEADDLPRLLADLSASKDASQNAAHIERLLILLRSASSPQASSLVRSGFSEDVLQPLATCLSGPDAQLRAAMAMSVLLGTAIVKSIISLDVVQECDSTKYRDAVAKVMTAALADPK
ncbi:MAG TPA: TetR family transcriptional regulator [Sphingomicrobium sp.]|nr:TetR family transcriptional regulator [Sphingomicrobium sp.]